MRDGRSRVAEALERMEAQRAEILKRLGRHGWELSEVEDEMLEWWADEVWLLESVWSPPGARAYVTFLVDPQSDTRNRKRGHGIWAVKASAARPTDWLAEEGEYTLSLGRGWEEELPHLFEYLDALRRRGGEGGG